MPTFTRNVPDDPRGPSFPIVRTPPAKPLIGIITSEDLVGCYTHYYKGRTVPCDGKACQQCIDKVGIHHYAEGLPIHKIGKTEYPCTGGSCEACADGLPYRWHAYQSAFCPSNSLHCLFECTAQAAEHFTDYRDAHGTIRGCAFEARRYNSRPNARILIRCQPADQSKIRLPKPPDLIKCLAILWGFPAREVQPIYIDPEKKTRRLKHISTPET